METIKITYSEGIWMPILITVNMLGLYGIIITLIWRDRKKDNKEEE